ncbi:unnamed protein product [Brassica napus]|uniref:(rape) hypothetical protein n=1 Tax=Brassica napus TaxID=3708 RepID=A0A816Q591_BRANA|nr:unnamed protein product [Brassica napus]
MASNLSTQGSMTVKEYEEYFLKHEVCKTMSEKSLISMYLACLNEKIRNSLKGTNFSTLKKLMECARLAEHLIEQGCMTIEEYKQFFVNHETEYHDEDPDERPENDSQTGSGNY